MHTAPLRSRAASDEDGTGLYSVSKDRQAMPGQMLHHFRCAVTVGSMLRWYLPRGSV